MASFDAVPIRQWDQSRRLIAAGAKWNEGRPFVLNVLVVLLCLGGFACIVSAVAALVMQAPGVAVIALLFGVLVVIIFQRGHELRTPREMLFHADGRITAPHGFPGYPRIKEIAPHHSDVASIESSEEADVQDDVFSARSMRYSIKVFDRDGSVYYAASKLDKDEAHKVAVQLNLALKEIRESVANVNRQPPPVPPLAQPARRRVIN